MSESFNEVSDKTKNYNTKLKDNKTIYDKYIPITVAFTNGKTIDFVIGSRRFKLLKQSTVGKVYKFKLHKQEIKKEVEAKFSWMRKTTITEYKYIPLIVERSGRTDWSILDDIARQ